jgi:predicted glycoside hydrolase/deacetylase ChbG (UPF0249 family)
MNPVSTPPPTQVLIQADDFGASPGTNEAILDCLDAGFVRNVGVMAPLLSLPHRFGELLERQTTFCPGLHATLTSEWAALRWGPLLPWTRVPSLIEPDGTFYRTTQTLHQRGVVAEMLEEIRSQLDHLRRLGLRVRYLDTHMCFAWIPGVADALTALCQTEGLIFVKEPAFSSLAMPAPSAVGWTPDQLRAALAGFAAAHPAARPVWIFHPAKHDAVSAKFYSDLGKPTSAVAEDRQREYAFLSDTARMTALLRSANVQPTTYEPNT